MHDHDVANHDDASDMMIDLSTNFCRGGGPAPSLIIRRDDSSQSRPRRRAAGERVKQTLRPAIAPIIRCNTRSGGGTLAPPLATSHQQLGKRLVVWRWAGLSVCVVGATL